MTGADVSAADVRVAPTVPARVFITGANGFIGKALAARLRELGAEVTGVDLRPDPSHGVVEGSTADPDSWKSALAGVDVVIHTAAIVSLAANYDDSWRVNVLGTSRVLQAAIDAGVPRFVHFSSIMAFGFEYPPAVDEDYPIRVAGYTYPDTKVNSEAVVMTAHAGGKIDATIVRPGDVYGPGSVWVREPLKMIKARQMILPAGGKGLFTQVYIDNLVDGVLLTLSNPAASGQVFTLTDGDHVTCNEYFGRLADMTGGSVTTLPTAVAVPTARTAGALLRRLRQPSELTDATMLHFTRKNSYSIEKARDLLGYQPRIGLDEGMKNVEAWARQEGIL
jgi:nucleoside-diphosphate-sugar epimerase